VPLELLNDDSFSFTHLGGMVGSVHFFEETPRINPARVRPFIWSILLLRSGVTPGEVIDSMAPHAHPDDLRVWEDELSPLEMAVYWTLTDLVSKGILRHSADRQELYVLESSKPAAQKAITVTSCLDAQLPDHLLSELGRDSQRNQFS